jgi:hypothetical protein
MAHLAYYANPDKDGPDSEYVVILDGSEHPENQELDGFHLVKLYYLEGPVTDLPTNRPMWAKDFVRA